MDQGTKRAVVYFVMDAVAGARRTPGRLKTGRVTPKPPATTHLSLLPSVFWDFGSFYQRGCGVISYALSRHHYFRLRLGVAAQASRTIALQMFLSLSTSRRLMSGLSRQACLFVFCLWHVVSFFPGRCSCCQYLLVTYGVMTVIDGIENYSIQMETALSCSERDSQSVGDEVDRCTLELQLVPEDTYARPQRAMRGSLSTASKVAQFRWRGFSVSQRVTANLFMDEF